MKSVLSTQPWLRDPEVVPIPWRQTLVDSTLSRASADGSSNYNTPLKLGIYWTNGVVGPHPPIDRGLRAVVDTLRKAGHKVNRIRPIIHFRLTDKNIYKGGRLEPPVAEHCQESSCHTPFPHPIQYLGPR